MSFPFWFPGPRVRRWTRHATAWFPPFAGFQRLLERGDLKYLILMVLKERSLHGYGLMKELSERFQYSPSAGIIYPTLQMLEDQGYVKASVEDGKKVYSITDDGRRYLEEHGGAVERITDGWDYFRRFEGLSFGRDIAEITRLVYSNHPYLSSRKMRQIEGLIAETRKKVREIIFE